MDMEIVPAAPDELDYFVAVNQHSEETENAFVEDDEAEQELANALERSRRVKVKKEEMTGTEDNRIENVAKQVLSKEEVKEEVDSVRNKLKKKKTSIVLDSTSEFCRTLGELPTIGGAKAAEPAAEPTHVPKADDDMDIEEPSTSTVNGWEKVDMVGEPSQEEEEEDDDVLEAEPIPT